MGRNSRAVRAPYSQPRGPGFKSPPDAVSKFGQFRSPHFVSFGRGNAAGSFCLVSVPGEL